MYASAKTRFILLIHFEMPTFPFFNLYNCVKIFVLFSSLALHLTTRVLDIQISTEEMDVCTSEECISVTLMLRVYL